MANEIIADSTLLQEADKYKAEFLAGMFGVAAHAATASGTSQVRARSSLSNIPLSSNVLGVGYGVKTAGGSSIQGEKAVRVYVRSKLPRRSLSQKELVPAEVNGAPTDVIPIGELTAAMRPTPCGVSIGHNSVTAGTLGCLVKRANDANGKRYILSNNHVLANSNNAIIGDYILEPGPIDGGDSTNPIAELADFEPLNDGVNFMDAAIARILNAAHVTPDIIEIGHVQQPVLIPALYQSVRKRGRTTLHTIGIIKDISADIRVSYGMRRCDFEDQIGVVGVEGAFGDRGDSGSLIVDAVTRRPVALLFAVALGITFASPITPILERFRIEIVTGAE